MPKVNAKRAKKIYRALGDAFDQGLVASCHDCSDGGLAVALAETAFAGGLGIAADISAVPVDKPLRPDYVLFSESQSRFVITVASRKAKEFESIMAGVPCARIGKVTKSPLLVINEGKRKSIISADIFDLKRAWQKPLDW